MNNATSTPAPRRTCGTCWAYDGGECLNGLGPEDPGYRCDQHRTHDEDRRATDALNRFRIGLGLPARRAV